MRLARRPGVLLYAALLNIILRNDDHLSLRVAYLEDRLQHLSSQVPLSATALGTSASSGPVLDTGTSSAASELPIPPTSHGTDRFEWVIYPVQQQENVSKSELAKLGLLRWPLGDEIFSSGKTSSNRESIFFALSLIDIGAFSIFSAENVETLRKFVGDSVLRAIVEEVGALEAKRDTTFYSDERHSLPPLSIVSRYIDGITDPRDSLRTHITDSYKTDFLMELNREIRLFDEQDVREAMKHHFESSVNHQPGWSMACNIILAHCVRNQSCCKNIAEYKRYFHGALVHVPRLMLGKGTPLEVSSLMAMVTLYTSKVLDNFTHNAQVLFCMFIGENQPAANLLGLAVRCMLRLEYHVQARQRQCTSLESLFQKRLFLKAYIFDRDLSMRLHSPPVISDSYIELPEETPVDGYSVYFLPGGVRVNYFREQVQLAKIQDQVHSELYSSQPIDLTQTQLHTKIGKLDTLLHSWRESLPESIRPHEPLFCVDYNQLICITALHYTYFQLIIAIHSSSLVFAATNGCPRDLSQDIRYCVTAARAMVTLLDYHDNGHPFAK
ncbi:fungal specific transcription factor [Aspergillus udagawae]|nr:fungal specific transcription factor [Aspergillus udagawae]